MPTLLDDTDKRGGAEQFGERWEPRIGGSGTGRRVTSRCWSASFELLGAIWLRAANELVMVFEDGFVAIVQSDRSFEVSWIYFEVAWIELPDNSKARAVVGGS